MRILQVNKFLYRRGGAEGYLLDLAEQQRAAGHEVEYFGMSHPDNLPMTYVEHFPSHVEFEPAPSDPRGRIELVGRMLWSKQAAAGMSAVLADFRPDVVHMHNIYHQLSPSMIRACAKAGVPVVMTLHDYKLACPTYQFLDQGQVCTACIGGSLTQAVKRRCKDGSLAASTIAAVEVGVHRKLKAYDPVARFLCPSAFLRDQMIAAGLHTDKMLHLDNFTDTDVPVRDQPGSGVLFAGRLSQEKGVDTLIEAAALLAPEVDGRVLDVVGDGPQRAEWEALADRVAPGVVRFHGRVSAEEVRTLLRGSRVSAITSRWYENQPLSVLEAFASGVPVVGTAMGGLNDLITPGVDGDLVPADDPVALAAALRPYLLDPELSQRHGAAARERALARHNPVSHAQRLTEIYREAIAAEARAS